MLNEYTLIEKEEVANLVFPQEEVLKKEKEKDHLITELSRAIALGNLEHHKVKIYFEDDQGKKMVHTTIWGLTDKSVVLKQNVIIPIRRINNIIL